MSTIFCVIILFLYTLDIFFCIKAIKEKNSNAYKITKPLLMPLLALSFATFLPKGFLSVKSNIYVVIALGCHTIGDILLLFPKSRGKIFFYGGMVSFFLGHWLYVLSFIENNISYSKTLAIIALCIAFVLEYLFYRQLVLGSRRHAPMFLPYTFGLATLAIVITSQLTCNPMWYAPVLSLLGTALFAFSDYCIARREMRMPIAGQMVVMPTYIAGQTLIVLGILLSQL